MTIRDMIQHISDSLGQLAIDPDREAMAEDIERTLESVEMVTRQAYADLTDAETMGLLLDTGVGADQLPLRMRN